MPAKIFISYRREDSAGQAGRVLDRLQREFGRDLLFMDVEGIPLGVDFVGVLREEVTRCGVLLAVIGPDWLAVERDGRRCLDNPDDFVRVEIATALERGVPVVPLLLDGTKMPRAEQLPDGLKTLALRNALDVRHGSFHQDMDRLIAELKSRLGHVPIARTPQKQRPRIDTRALVLGAVLVIALAVAVPYVRTMLQGPELNKPQSPSAEASVRQSPIEMARQDGTGTGGGTAKRVTEAGAEQSALPATQGAVVSGTQVAEGNAGQPPVTQMAASSDSNLLSPEAGGELIAAPDASWSKAISGKEGDEVAFRPVQEAVYGFKGEKRATFSRFAILIASTYGGNVKEFELSAGNESPTGGFRSLGRFSTQNVRLIKSPYQEFTFPATTAKYFKLKVLSSYGGSNLGDTYLTQIRLFGRLAE